MIDTIPKLSGYVSLTCVNDTTGEVRRCGSNLVVNGLYSQLCYSLSGSLVNRTISQVEFGTGTAPADVTDVGVTHLSPQVVVPVTVTYPSTTSVKFTAVWESAEVNGASVTEVGLLFANNVLAARWLFAAMKKSAGWTWTIDWTLSFTL